MPEKIKNIQDMREMIAEEIEKLRIGKVDPKRLNAICNGVGKIIQTTKLQLEYSKMIGATPNIPFIGSKLLSDSKK